MGQPVSSPDDTLRAVRYTHLFGVGGVNLLDTYISPLEYTGWQVSTLHLTDRALRPASRWRISSRYGGDVSHTLSPTSDGKRWDANFYAAVSLRRRWQPVAGLTLEGGAMGEAYLGGTYSERGGNNPAQARVGLQVGISGLSAYEFRFLRKRWRALLAADVPLAGAAFTPCYGQSYYEIFELGHSDRNVRFTYVGNAPSVLLTAGVEVALGRSWQLVAGYQADVRQQHIAGIKRHNWGNRFIIGWSRRLHVVKD